MEYRPRPQRPDTTAPDGSEITFLSTSLSGGSMVLCTLRPGAVTRPISHRTVEEMWHVISGSGLLWRSRDGEESVVDLESGVSVTIPLGTRFQFRCDGDRPMEIVIATMPPWPGDNEAISSAGPWESTV